MNSVTARLTDGCVYAHGIMHTEKIVAQCHSKLQKERAQHIDCRAPKRAPRTAPPAPYVNLGPKDQYSGIGAGGAFSGSLMSVISASVVRIIAATLARSEERRVG